MSANTNLGNTPVSQGFSQLYHTGETGGLTTTLQQVFDGDGTGSDLHLATNKVKIATPANFLLGSDSITEFIQDVVGSMLTTGSYTNVTTTYDDSNGNIDISASGEVTLTGSQTLTNKTFTSPVINTGVSGTAILDEDTMSSNSDSKLATQQSIKAYVDAEVAGIVNSAPSALDTLDELASALGDDANFATTTATSLGEKLVKSSNLSDLTNTATARSNLGVDASGTDNSTNVTLAGSRDYITISGQEITRNQIDISDDTNLVGGTGITLTGDTLSTTDSEIVHDNLSGFVANEHKDHSGININTASGSGLSGGGDITSSRSLTLDVNNLTAQVPALTLSDKVAIYDTDPGETNVATLTQLKAIVNTDTNTMGSGFVLEDGDGTEVTITENKELKFIDGNGLNINFTDTDNGSDADPFDLTFSVDISPLSLDSSPDEQDLLIIEDATDGSIKKTKVGLVGGGGTITSVSNFSDNRVLTASGSTTINGESNLTFDGTDLAIASSGKLYFGGGSHTYIHEQADDILEFVVGNDILMKLTEAGSGIEFPQDSHPLKIGAGSDLQLNHNGSNSFVENYTGNLNIINNTDDGDIILKSDDGSGGTTAYLTLDGSIAKTTLNKDLRAVDDVRITAGNGDDFQVFHNGTNTFVKNNTGDFYISNDADDKDLILRSDDGSGGQTAYLTLDGSLERMEAFKNLKFGDSVQALFGASNDLKIRHDGSNSIIQAEGTGDLTIRQDTADKDILLRCDDGSGGIATYLTLDGSATQTLLHQDTSLTATKKLFLDGGGNTYIQEDIADRVRFFCGGAEFLRFTEDSSDNLRLMTNNTTALFIDNSQNIGIGTTSPSEKLEVSGKILATGGQVRAGSYLEGFPSFSFANDTDTGMFSDTANQLEFSTGGSSRLTINSSGDVGIGETSIDANLHITGSPVVLKMERAGQRAMRMGTPDNSSLFIFADSDDLKSNQRMVIDNSGNVGINTTSPGALFTIRKDGTQASSVSTTYQMQTISDSNGGIAIQAGDSSIAYLVFGDNGDYDAGRIAYKNASHDLCFYTNNAEEMVLDSDGDLHVDRDVVAFSTTPSDKRLKKNIKDIDYGLDTIMKLNPKQYDWKKDDTHDIGFIAQEVEKVIPEIVKDKKHFDKEIKTLDYEKLTAVLIKAVQELKQEIEDLK